MTTKEFSQEFDIKLNSLEGFNAYGLTIGNTIRLNEYEKSIFLTEAQNQLIKEYYTGKNNYRESFEQNEDLKRSLQSLVNTVTFNHQVAYTTLKGVSKYSQFYDLTSQLSTNELWYIIYESATINKRITIVKPITHDDAYSILRNPLKANYLERTFRLEFNDDTIELINKYPITEYLIRYIKNPSPIILEDFENLTIDGFSTITECRLHESIHRTILDRAYILALQSRSIRMGNKQEKSDKDSDK